MLARIHGPEPYDKAVAQAIAQVHKLLHSGGVHTIWRNSELREPADGRRHTLPLLVLTVNGLWVADILTRRGSLHAEDDLWRWKSARSGAELAEEPPFASLRERTARLRELLQLKGLGAVDVRPLVLLAPADSEGILLGTPRRLIRDDLACCHAVEGLRSAEELLLAAPGLNQRPVTMELAEALSQALPQIGVQPVLHRQVAGGYRLGDLLAEHDTWQEHRAESTDDPQNQARVRTWIIPSSPDPQHRDALSRAAEREAEVLQMLGQHPNILGLLDRVDHGGVSRLIFEPFSGAVPLDIFMRAHKGLPFDQRLSILEQVALALDHCHRHEVTHRCLSPKAVLVRLHEGQSQVRLHHFEGALARAAEATALGTRHLSRFSERMLDLYRAPELFRDPDAASEASDLFSLGALAWYLFVGSHPGPTVAARRKRLEEGEGLRLWEHRDDLDDRLDELVANATHPRMERRLDSVRKWINAVVALYREPGDEDAAPVDPLLANIGDPLGDDIVVTGILGSGASARVLEVNAAGEQRALKVPHDLNAQRLVEAEHAVLSRLAHANVVRAEDDMPVLSGRRCLLMQHAGDETLGDRIRREGTLPLDYAQRLGDELLQVLEYLHGEGVTHRDIKPSNLAFTSLSNRARQLLLYDFSLAALPAVSVRAGTPRWRDPGLQERGAWDPAADLYAGAAVLHYALAGERPAWVERKRRVRIVDARFDPDLRGALAGFFRRAFAIKVAERYPDAESMRRAWDDVFAKDITSVPLEVSDTPLDDRLARARLDTSIGALGLTSRAMNALERAGVANVRDLLGLPRNRLSLVRGVGHETRDEICRAIDILEPRLGRRDDARQPAFLEGVHLPPLPLVQTDLGLPQEVLDALHDAALRSIRDLAQASAERVTRLLDPHGVDLPRLKAALQRCVPVTPIAGPLGDWVATLVQPNPQRSKRTKWEERLGVLVGLEPMPDGADDEAPPGGRGNAEVACALGITPVVFRSSFQKARDHWNRHVQASDGAVAAIGAALDRTGPVATIPDVGRAMVEDLAPPLTDQRRAHLQAIALVRFGTEVGVPDTPFSWRRIGRHAWLARSPAELDALQALGRVADQLAGDHPAPLEAAQGALRKVALPPLADLAPEQLVQLAVAASEKAALSPRLEVYARAMPAHRALELAGAVIIPGLNPEQVRQRVATRYPEAEALPGRPELDALLATIGLRWSVDRQAYLRPGSVGSTLTATEAWRTSLASTTSGRPTDVVSARCERFDTSLQHAAESGRFRAIQVSARRAEQAAQALRRRHPQLLVTDLDAEIWSRLQTHIQEHEADPQFILQVDREGPEGQHWQTFVEAFVQPVVEELLEHLLAERQQPRLLVHAGLLARYRQASALDHLVQQVELEEGAAVWLLLPAWDDGASPLLRHPQGDLPVPVYKPAQRMRAPRAWIRRTLPR